MTRTDVNRRYERGTAAGGRSVRWLEPLAGNAGVLRLTVGAARDDFAVRLLEESGGCWLWSVRRLAAPGSAAGPERRVALSPDGTARCTCPAWSGTCVHAEMMVAALGGRPC